MKVILGPSVYEHILHFVVIPKYGYGVDITQITVNAGFLVVKCTNSEVVTVDSTTLKFKDLVK